MLILGLAALLSTFIMPFNVVGSASGLAGGKLFSMESDSSAHGARGRLINEASYNPGKDDVCGGYMKATLDRIEGDMAVLLIRDEERIKIDFPLELLPDGSREGDILDITIKRDDNAADDARKRTSELIERLKRKSSTSK